MAKRPPPLADAFAKAVEAGDLPAVKKLLEAGADPNTRPAQALCPKWNKKDVDPATGAMTMLMLATASGHGDIAKLLLDKKADPLATDQFNKTAAMYALEFGHSGMWLSDVIKSLTPEQIALSDRVGGDHERDVGGDNLITYAVLDGAASIVGSILHADAALKALVIDGEHKSLDVLSLAALHGQDKVIKKLLENPDRCASLLEHSKLNGGRPAKRRLARSSTRATAASRAL